VGTRALHAADGTEGRGAVITKVKNGFVWQKKKGEGWVNCAGQSIAARGYAAFRYAQDATQPFATLKTLRSLHLSSYHAGMIPQISVSGKCYEQTRFCSPWILSTSRSSRLTLSRLWLCVSGAVYALSRTSGFCASGANGRRKQEAQTGGANGRRKREAQTGGVEATQLRTNTGSRAEAGIRQWTRNDSASTETLSETKEVHPGLALGLERSPWKPMLSLGRHLVLTLKTRVHAARDLASRTRRAPDFTTPATGIHHSFTGLRYTKAR